MLESNNHALGPLGDKIYMVEKGRKSEFTMAKRMKFDQLSCSVIRIKLSAPNLQQKKKKANVSTLLFQFQLRVFLEKKV